MGASSAIEGVKPTALPARAYCPLHPTGDRGSPTAAVSQNKSQRTCYRGKAKAKMHTQVLLQDLILMLVSSVTVRKSVIIVNVN